MNSGITPHHSGKSPFEALHGYKPSHFDIYDAPIDIVPDMELG
jgi:hypothetical protein